MLNKYIVNFREYACLYKPGPDMFDLLLWSICCGALSLSTTLFRHCPSPIRAAFFALNFSQQLVNNSFGGEKSALGELRTAFQDASSGILEGLLHPTTRREILLNVPKQEEQRRTGFLLRAIPSDGEYGSLIDCALRLKCKEFIAHAYCQSVIDELWRGRSRWGGYVWLRQRPSAYSLFLQLAVPIILTLDVEANPLFDRKMEESEKSEGVSRGVAGASTDDRDASRGPSGRRMLRRQSTLLLGAKEAGRKVEQALSRAGQLRTARYLPWWLVLASLFQIPLFKRVVMLSSHVAFTVLFVIVATKPLCGPIGTTHYVVFVWGCSLAMHALADSFIRRYFWWKARCASTVSILHMPGGACVLSSFALIICTHHLLSSLPPHTLQIEPPRGRSHPGSVPSSSSSLQPCA